MKTLLRSYFYSLFSLWIATLLISGFHIKGGLYSFLYSAVVFALLHLLVKPIIKLIFFPVNLFTFGLFSWFINVIILYLLVQITNLIQVSAWNFPGINYANIAISAYHFSLWQTFIVTSLFIGIIVNLLFWLAK